MLLLILKQPRLSWLWILFFEKFYENVTRCWIGSTSKLIASEKMKKPLLNKLSLGKLLRSFVKAIKTEFQQSEMRGYDLLFTLFKTWIISQIEQNMFLKWFAVFIETYFRADWRNVIKKYLQNKFHAIYFYSRLKYFHSFQSFLNTFQGYD